MSSVRMPVRPLLRPVDNAAESGDEHMNMKQDSCTVSAGPYVV